MRYRSWVMVMVVMAWCRYQISWMSPVLVGAMLSGRPLKVLGTR